MKREKQLKQIESTAAVYHTDELAGPNEQYHLYLRDAVIPERRGRSALELGCGKGLWTEVLCDRYDAVDVVEASSELIGIVKRANADKRATLTTHNCLVEDFDPRPGQKWQSVYMTFLLEHLVDPVGVLGQIGGYLENDGRLFLAVPNANSVHRVVAERMGLIARVDQLSANDIKVGHLRVYTWELLRTQLAAAGLRMIREIPIGLKVVSLGQMKDWSAEMVQAFCSSGDLAPCNAAYIAAEVARE